MRSMYYKPGVYVIRVAGGLDAEWSDRLGGLTIAESETTGDDAGPIVELTGWLADQAALYGVLNTLYDNRYPLLYVQYLGPSRKSHSLRSPARTRRSGGAGQYTGRQRSERPPT